MLYCGVETSSGIYQYIVGRGVNSTSLSYPCIYTPILWSINLGIQLVSAKAMIPDFIKALRLNVLLSKVGVFVICTRGYFER